MIRCSFHVTIFHIWIRCLLCWQKAPQDIFLAKSEIFKNKFVSGFFRFCGAIPIDRKNGIQGIRSAVDKLESGNVVGIFPEGTRSKTGKLGKPKSGIIMVAQRCKSDIIPGNPCNKTSEGKAIQKNRNICRRTDQIRKARNRFGLVDKSAKPPAS